MSEEDLQRLFQASGVSGWRLRLAQWIECGRVQAFIVSVILLNSIILGMETSASLMADYGIWLIVADKACLAIFVVEIAIKLVAYRWYFWRSGWNVFDFLIVGIALVPATGAWSVLRALRVLRVLRLLSIIPALRKVVLAFLHAIPGLLGVITVMVIFFYVAAVLATQLFGGEYPQWFGTIGHSLFTLFQIMTLESWSMGVVRPVMETFPWAWAFFVPFIIIATFTILNLFIGIIVSTMQELALKGSEEIEIGERKTPEKLLGSIERDLAELRTLLNVSSSPDAPSQHPTGTPGAPRPPEARSGKS